jgi:hypothetical protein
MGGHAEPSAPPWAEVLERDAAQWRAAREVAERGPRILIATSMGGFKLASLVESALAVALTLRGARVEILLCDGFLPACQQTEILNTEPEQILAAPPLPRCDTCERFGRGVFSLLGLPTHWLGGLLPESEVARARELSREIPLEKIGSFELDGLAVGEHALAGALRYFARADLEGEPHAGAVLRRYLEASLLTSRAVEALLARGSFQAACFHHGIYVPQGLVGEVCRARGVRVVNWNPAYRKQSFVFSHGASYHHTMQSEPPSEWEALAWSPELEARTLEYLESRRRGTEDWIWFHDEPDEDPQRLVRALDLDLSKPVVGLLTSVVWDACLHYESKAFPDMVAWVLASIDYFRRRPDLQLVIRIHPAEVHGGNPSRQRMAAEISRVWRSLPPNVRVVPPESPISTYALADLCNAALIYNTKTGIELSSRGIPVVVAGEAWIRGKGFSLDADSPQAYFDLLDRLPLEGGLDPRTLERARRYAFHFFFRRMIPLPFVAGGKGFKFALSIASLKELAPGACRGLDLVCDGILAGRPLVYPAEEEPLGLPS